MVRELREKYNSEFSEKKYQLFIEDLNSSKAYPVDFRVSETPIFLSPEFKKKVIKAAEEITNQLKRKEFKEKAKDAIPKELFVPNEDENPLFLQIDFAICKDENDNIIPQLIELQGFPSLYCFQYFLNEKFRKHFSISENLTTYFNGLNDESYIKIIKEAILNNEDPENVILLEIEHEKQKTRIDFACTEDIIGIKTISLSDVIKKGKNLYYKNNSKEILIKRIYNRVIYDELRRISLEYNFRFTDALDVKWAGHPNWFFKISKHSLPFLKGEFLPSCYFFNELDQYPDDLENYVLKPLYSFAGLGVEVDLTKNMLDKIKDKSNYILQKKIEYAPLIKTPDVNAKAEIRMMFIWKDEPFLVNNLVRMSKGKMMGVAFNKDKTWIGSSAAYHI